MVASTLFLLVVSNNRRVQPRQKLRTIQLVVLGRLVFAARVDYGVQDDLELEDSEVLSAD